MREYQKRWMADRRAKAVELLGGKCAWCDSTNRLEIDHVRPARSYGYTSPGGSMWSWSWDRIVAEPDILHGTSSMWHRFKCRCQTCRDWMAASKRDYRARKRSQLAMAQLG